MATIEKWAPLPEFDVLERGLRRFFDHAGMVSGVTPAADVYEADGELILELEVPGFDSADLNILLSDHMLLIRGEHEEKVGRREKAVRVGERLEPRFERRFQLPPSADTEHLRADYRNGVLEVHIPTLPAPTPKTIEIETA